MSSGAATLWLADVRDSLATNVSNYADCLAFLTPDERRRYAGFIRAQRQLEFLASRLLLRLAISRHLQIATAAIEVSVEADAAPHLRVNGSTTDVPFSVCRTATASSLAPSVKPRRWVSTSKHTIRDMIRWPSAAPHFHRQNMPGFWRRMKRTARLRFISCGTARKRYTSCNAYCNDSHPHSPK